MPNNNDEDIVGPAKRKWQEHQKKKLEERNEGLRKGERIFTWTKRIVTILCEKPEGLNVAQISDTLVKKYPGASDDLSEDRLKGGIESR